MMYNNRKVGYKNMVYTSITQLVGRTPLIEFGKYEKANQLPAHLLGKLEYLNPAGSIKDRPALFMIRQAEQDGILKPGDTIVEQTSGNTGIALAAYGVALGYHLEIFLEAGVTPERKTMLKGYGAVLRDYRDLPGEDPDQPFDEFREATMAEIEGYCKAHGPRYHYLNQVTNKANPRSHMVTTGPEIWEDTDGMVDALVCMVGTGGTLHGLSTYLRGKNPDLYVLAVQPAPCSRRSRQNPYCPIIDGVLNFNDVDDKELTDFILRSDYQECMDITCAEAYQTARSIGRLQGILLGTSASAALTAAARLAKRPAMKGKNIVVILPDGGDKYLSTRQFY